MATDSESGAEPLAGSASPVSLTVRLEGQRGDQLGYVQRVAGCVVGEPRQAAVRPAAGQGGYQVSWEAGGRRLVHYM